MKTDQWRKRLNRALRQKRDAFFKWGQNDCALFMADIMKRVHSVDPARWFRGRYDSKQEAIDALRTFCGGGLEKAMQKVCDNQAIREKKPGFADDGDGALVEADAGGFRRALGVHLRNNVLIAAEEGGYIALPRDRALTSYEAET